jgi:hypothetical protein
MRQLRPPKNSAFWGVAQWKKAMESFSTDSSSRENVRGSNEGKSGFNLIRERAPARSGVEMSVFKQPRREPINCSRLRARNVSAGSGGLLPWIVAC